MRYALVCEGVLINIILWDGEDEYVPDEGCEIIESPPEVAIGWRYEEGEWIAPDLEEQIVPTEDPAVIAARESAAQELIALGVSEGNARTIVGLPPL